MLASYIHDNLTILVFSDDNEKAETSADIISKGAGIMPRRQNGDSLHDFVINTMKCSKDRAQAQNLKTQITFYVPTMQMAFVNKRIVEELFR
jgi:hypothetical protein